MTHYIDPRQEFSLAEAGRLVGCSADKVAKRLHQGKMPDARRDPHSQLGKWLVTARDLVAAGLLDEYRLIPIDDPDLARWQASPEQLVAQLAARDAELAARSEEVTHLRALVDRLVAS